MKKYIVLILIIITACNNKENLSVDESIIINREYGIKLYSEIYEYMTEDDYLKIGNKVSKQLNHKSGYMIVFDDGSSLEYKLAPEFENDSLMYLDLEIKGDTLIKNDGSNLQQNEYDEEITQKFRNKLSKLYSEKYGNYKISIYTETKGILKSKYIQFQKQIWENEDKLIIFDPHKKMIRYISKAYHNRLANKEKKMNERIEKEEDKKREELEGQKLNTKKNI